MFGPAALAYLLALGFAVSAAVDSVLTNPEQAKSGALLVGFAAISFLGIFEGTLVLAGCVLLLWAIAIWLLSLIPAFGRMNDVQLDVWLFSDESTHAQSKLTALRGRTKAWFLRHRWRAPFVALLILLACELIAEVASNASFFVGISAWERTKTIWPGVALQIFLFGLLWGVGLAALLVLDFVLERLEGVKRSQTARHVARDPAFAPESWFEDRESAQGSVELQEGDGTVAPVSGKRCAAFRLVGRLNGIVIDDAGAGSFALEVGGSTVRVRGTRFVALLPEPVDELHTLDENQRKRVRRFLKPRGIPLPKTGVVLAESLLEAGDSARVYGARVDEVEADGYRGTTVNRILDDSDGQPVLVESA